MIRDRHVKISYQAVNDGGTYRCVSPKMESHEAAESWIAEEAELNGEYRIEKRYELTGAMSFGQWIRRGR